MARAFQIRLTRVAASPVRTVRETIRMRGHVAPVVGRVARRAPRVLSTDGAIDATENDDDFVHALVATSWLMT